MPTQNWILQNYITIHPAMFEMFASAFAALHPQETFVVLISIIVAVEFSLNVFTPLNSVTKIFVITVKGLKLATQPATSCVKDQCP